MMVACLPLGVLPILQKTPPNLKVVGLASTEAVVGEDALLAVISVATHQLCQLQNEPET